MKTLAERFWPRVNKDGPIPAHRPDLGPCWLWTGPPQNKHGYCSIKVSGRMRPAHRVAYELETGPIPTGLEIDHLCRVRNCVNPAHLEAVTHAENVRRGDYRNAGKKGGATTGARNRAKTHCPEGHPYSGKNLYVHGRSRNCAECRLAAARRYYHRTKEKYGVRPAQRKCIAATAKAKA